MASKYEISQIELKISRIAETFKSSKLYVSMTSHNGMRYALPRYSDNFKFNGIKS